MFRRCGGLVAMGLALGMVVGCGSPQIGTDPAAFKTVDALYTAVSLRDPGQVERCEQDLGRLHESGGLPDPAHRMLTTIVARTRRDDGWERARRDLRDFMRAQRP